MTDLQHQILEAIHARDDERSAQVLIGPSELGMECERCLAKKLAGIGYNREADWFPFIGTCVHAGLQDLLARRMPHLILERRITVGIVFHRLIQGRCDVFDPDTGTVLDFKIVGKSTRDKVKRDGPIQQYVTQANLYARGWELTGHEPKRTAIFFLPRDSASLNDSIWWEDGYDRNTALDYLDRAEVMFYKIEEEGYQAVNGFPRADGCYDCYRYYQLPGEDAPNPLPKQGNPGAYIFTKGN